VWKADITIHDADRNGFPTPQISVDPATGNLAHKEINIIVVCAQNEAATAPAVSTPSIATTTQPTAVTPPPQQPTAPITPQLGPGSARSPP